MSKEGNAGPGPAIVAFVAVLLSALNLVIPWGEIQMAFQGGGASASNDVDYTFFTLDDKSWYDSDHDVIDGIEQARTSVPIMGGGAIVLLVGAALLALTAARGGPALVSGLVAFAGGLVLAIGVLLMQLAVMDMADSINASNDFGNASGTAALGLGHFIGYGAGIGGLAGGLWGLLGNRS